MCEFLHSNTPITPQGEQCPGCRQSGICVCLVPVALDSPKMPPQKKRTHSQKSSLIRKDTTTPITGSVPIKQDSPVGAGKSITTTPDLPPPISVTGERDVLKGSSASSCSSSSSFQTYPPEAYHLLMRLLDPSPDTRITAAEALAHPFLNP